jgi:hypothetical protein
MKCEFCSSPIPKGSNHCPDCGAPAPQEELSLRPTPAPDPQGLFNELYSPDRPAFARDMEAVIPPTNNTAKPTDALSSPAAPPRPGNSRRNGFAIASVILAVISSCAGFFPCCTLPLPVAAIILGILGLPSQRKVIALIGIAIGAFSLLVSIGVSIAFLSSPEFAQIWQGN